MKETTVKRAVREGYARIVKQGGSCCAPAGSCCGTAEGAKDLGRSIGYTEEELNAIPEGTVALGCGNPVALASLQEGEIVLDLGSGAGIDCFIASGKVGWSGKIIGVDMTPEMIERARENAEKGNYANVEFRLGEIENLPVADNSVDVVISNCVINLSPDKARVFREAYRVLKPGGRLMISDMVLLKELPAAVKNSIGAYVGCLAGAVLKDEYLAAVDAAGFRDIRIIDEVSYSADFITNNSAARSIIESLQIPLERIEELFGAAASIRVSGIKRCEAA